MALELTGKVVMVTGAARRVGAAIAHRLHSAGAAVVVHYRSPTGEAQALVADFERVRPGSALALQADLLDAARLPELVRAAVARYGRLDALVNNASSFYRSPLAAIDETQWADLVGSNFKAPLFLTQAAAPHLRAVRGAVVNIVDIHAERPLAGYPLYCAAKAGLAGLTRALAVELAPEVRVNGVAPGPVLWPQDGAFDAAARRDIVADTLLGREGTPQEIADAVLFLIAAAGYVTGQIIAVDGGRSAHL